MCNYRNKIVKSRMKKEKYDELLTFQKRERETTMSLKLKDTENTHTYIYIYIYINLHEKSIF